MLSLPFLFLPGGLVVNSLEEPAVRPVLASPVVTHSMQMCMFINLEVDYPQSDWKFYISLYKENDTSTPSMLLGYYNYAPTNGTVTLPVGTYRVIFVSSGGYEELRLKGVSVTDGACSMGRYDDTR